MCNTPPACYWQRCHDVPVLCADCSASCCPCVPCTSTSLPIIAVTPAGDPLTPAGTVHWKADAVWAVPHEFLCPPCKCKEVRCGPMPRGILDQMSGASGLRPDRLTELLLGSALPCTTKERCKPGNIAAPRCKVPFTCERDSLDKEFHCQQYMRWREAMLKRMGQGPTPSECRKMLGTRNEYGGKLPPKNNVCPCCMDEGDDDIDSDLRGNIRLRATASSIHWRQLQQQYLARYHRRLSKSAERSRNRGWLAQMPV